MGNDFTNFHAGVPRPVRLKTTLAEFPRNGHRGAVVV